MRRLLLISAGDADTTCSDVSARFHRSYYWYVSESASESESFVYDPTNLATGHRTVRGGGVGWRCYSLKGQKRDVFSVEDKKLPRVESKSQRDDSTFQSSAAHSWSFVPYPVMHRPASPRGTQRPGFFPFASQTTLPVRIGQWDTRQNSACPTMMACSVLSGSRSLSCASLYFKKAMPTGNPESLTRRSNRRRCAEIGLLKGWRQAPLGLRT